VPVERKFSNSSFGESKVNQYEKAQDLPIEDIPDEKESKLPRIQDRIVEETKSEPTLHE
jgi:hypothetical protein